MLVMLNPWYGFALLVLVLIFLRRRGKSLSYLFFFSLFWLYLMLVVSLIVFTFPVGVPHDTFRPRLNLIPLHFGYCGPRALEQCLRQIYGNVLLTIPFGFGVFFVAPVKPRHMVWWGLGVGSTLEFLQLLISLIFRTSFRVVDINDVILNALGVLLGYAAFRVFGSVYLFVLRRFQLRPRYLFAYVREVLLSQHVTRN